MWRFSRYRYRHHRYILHKHYANFLFHRKFSYDALDNVKSVERSYFSLCGNRPNLQSYLVRVKERTTAVGTITGRAVSLPREGELLNLAPSSTLSVQV